MRSPGSSDGDVVEDVACEESAVLQAGAYAPSQFALVGLGQVVVIVGDTATQRCLKSQQQAHQCGFTASRLARNAHVFASLDVERQIVDHQRHIVLIAERQVVDADIA